MFSKVSKKRNCIKYKSSYQTRINITQNPYLFRKLKSKKWYFLRFKNTFKYFPRIGKVSKIRFFHKNSLHIKRFLKSKNCFIKSSNLYKLYLKSSQGNPKYLNLLNLLESRLDVCLFRTGLFPSVIGLRQFILHKNIYLNGNLVTKPGILLKKNDLVQINFVHLDFDNYFKILAIPLDHLSHLEIDLKTFSFIYLGPCCLADFSNKKYQDLSFLNYIFKS
jgi:ribosomal protein S4